MRLNRFLTSGTISLKHYLRAFYTLLPLSCFFKDNPRRKGAFFPRFIRRKQKTELGPFTSESSSILPYYRKSGIKTTVTVDISKKNAKFVSNLSCFLKPSAMKPSFRLPRRKIVERKSTLSINRAQNRRCSNSAKAENNGVKTNCFVEPRI